MKQKVFLMAVACVLLSAVAAFAQTKTDFSGNWTLDVSKSKFDERSNYESGTLTVTQTDKDITVKSDLKRAPRPDGGGAMAGGTPPAGGGQGGGMGRGMGGAQPALTYTLDGKEVSMPFGNGDRAGTAKLKSSWDSSKLNLTSTRTAGPNGEFTSTQKETWELVDGGKALKVHRDTQSQRGSQSIDFYYTKS